MDTQANDGVNVEQKQAIDEVAQDREIYVDRSIITTENIRSQTSNNEAGAELMKSRAKFYGTLGGSVALVALAGAAAMLIAVIQ